MASVNKDKDCPEYLKCLVEQAKNLPKVGTVPVGAVDKWLQDLETECGPNTCVTVDDYDAELKKMSSKELLAEIEGNSSSIYLDPELEKELAELAELGSLKKRKKSKRKKKSKSSKKSKKSTKTKKSKTKSKKSKRVKRVKRSRTKRGKRSKTKRGKRGKRN